MNKYKMIFTIIAILAFVSCQPQPDKQTLVHQNNTQKADNNSLQKATDVKVMFYNVENLFDTKDDPRNPNDNEYLPYSHKKWTPERYNAKLKNIAKVIKEAGTPHLIGVAEVENMAVLEDLVDFISDDNWQIIHKDSPDERGIDVALIYNANIFSLNKNEFLTVDLPREKDDATGRWRDDKTRDILYANLNIGNETIDVFVNHWSSRRNPDEKRVVAAKQAKNKVDQIKAQNPNANILLMGDFNDTPTNISLFKALDAQNPNSNIINKNNLYNLGFPESEKGHGTYNYKGEYNLMDQIIVSGNMLQNSNKVHTSYQSFNIIDRDWMSFNHPKYGKMPNRTYGSEYYGGYSDHYPVVIELEVR